MFMLVDLTKLNECCFPAIHSIGSRGLKMFKTYYIDSYSIRRIVSLEFACRVNTDLRSLVFSMLGDSLNRVEIDAQELLYIERILRERIDGVLDDYLDAVYIGNLDRNEEWDDILTAVDRYTLMLLSGFSAGIRYRLAGAYGVSLCKVNNEESYVIRLDETGEGFDKGNPRKIAQSNSWQGSFRIDAGFAFLWLGRRVRLNNVVHIEVNK